MIVNHKKHYERQTKQIRLPFKRTSQENSHYNDAVGFQSINAGFGHKEPVELGTHHFEHAQL